MHNQNEAYMYEQNMGEPTSNSNRYSSVEFSIRELSYQFKLWNIGSDSMQIVIKDGSDILDWLKVGNR